MGMAYTKHEQEVQDRSEITCVQCLDGACPTQAETVKIDICIEISERDVIDTEMSVEKWNALTANQRQNLIREAWLEMAARDDGGICVITEGAAEA